LEFHNYWKGRKLPEIYVQLPKGWVIALRIGALMMHFLYQFSCLHIQSRRAFLEGRFFSQSERFESFFLNRSDWMAKTSPPKR